MSEFIYIKCTECGVLYQIPAVAGATTIHICNPCEHGNPQNWCADCEDIVAAANKASSADSEGGEVKDIVEELEEVGPHYPPRHILNRVLAEIKRLRASTPPTYVHTCECQGYHGGAVEMRERAATRVGELRKYLEQLAVEASLAVADNAYTRAAYEVGLCVAELRVLPVTPEPAEGKEQITDCGCGMGAACMRATRRPIKGGE